MPFLSKLRQCGRTWSSPWLTFRAQRRDRRLEYTKAEPTYGVQEGEPWPLRVKLSDLRWDIGYAVIQATLIVAGSLIRRLRASECYEHSLGAIEADVPPLREAR